MDWLLYGLIGVGVLLVLVGLLVRLLPPDKTP
jgi:hypothetical protein